MSILHAVKRGAIWSTVMIDLAVTGLTTAQTALPEPQKSEGQAVAGCPANYRHALMDLKSLEDDSVHVGAGDAHARVVETLTACLTDSIKESDTLLVASAVRELLLSGETAVELIASLKDQSCLVRVSAAKALLSRAGARSGGLGQLHDARAAAPLTVCLKDPNASIRSRAAEVLVYFGDAVSAEPLIASLKHPDASVRSSAAAALGQLGDARAAEPLIASLRGDPAWQTRANAAFALGQLGDARAVEPLIASLRDDPRFDTRAAASIALGQLGDARAVEPLVLSLKGPGRVERASAAAALRKLSPTLLVEGKTVQAYLADVDRQEQAMQSQERLARIAASLPPDRDKNAIYWLVETAGTFRLKNTIPCQAGSGAFLAETSVPCGAVFVNQENQIGGSFYFIP